MYHTILGKESSLFSIAMDSFYGLNEKKMVSILKKKNYTLIGCQSKPEFNLSKHRFNYDFS